ncbi:MAG: hypothetical protein EBR82_74005 [Caulobacteraceae bacterium]|nr:hypothetical protein [Caulobacteraceae bacterium]
MWRSRLDDAKGCNVAFECIGRADDCVMWHAPVGVIDTASGFDLGKEAFGAVTGTENGRMGSNFPKAIRASAMQAMDLKASHAGDCYGGYV